jgi:hypothetical protein
MIERRIVAAIVAVGDDAGEACADLAPDAKMGRLSAPQQNSAGGLADS